MRLIRWVSSAGKRARWQRYAILTLVFVPCLLLPPAVNSAESKDNLPDLKVAFIYNFTRFIRWPEAPADQPFVICVIDDTVMENHLRLLEQEARQVDGRPITIRGYASPGVPGPCEILFIGAAVEAELDSIVRRTHGKPVLLVGDTPGYAGRGVAVELFIRSDIFRKKERLRLRIDPASLRDRGLVVSAQLYDVAEVIE